MNICRKYMLSIRMNYILSYFYSLEPEILYSLRFFCCKSNEAINQKLCSNYILIQKWLMKNKSEFS